MKKLFGLFLFALLLLSACGQGKPAGESAAPRGAIAGTSLFGEALLFPFYPREPYPVSCDIVSQTIPTPQGDILIRRFTCDQYFYWESLPYLDQGRVYMNFLQEQNSSGQSVWSLIFDTGDPSASQVIPNPNKGKRPRVYHDYFYYYLPNAILPGGKSSSVIIRRDEKQKKEEIFYQAEGEMTPSLNLSDGFLIWHEIAYREENPGGNPYLLFCIRAIDLNDESQEAFTVGETDAFYSPYAHEYITDGFLAYPKCGEDGIEIVCYSLQEQAEVFAYSPPAGTIPMWMVYDGRYLAYSTSTGTPPELKGLFLYDTRSQTSERISNGSSMHLWGEEYLLFTEDAQLYLYHIPSGEILFTSAPPDSPESAPRYSYIDFFFRDPDAGDFVLLGDDRELGRTVFLTVTFPE